MHWPHMLCFLSSHLSEKCAFPQFLSSKRQNWVGDQGKQLPTAAQESEPKGKAGCGGAGMWFPCPCREGACCSLPMKNHWRFSTISTSSMMFSRLPAPSLRQNSRNKPPTLSQGKVRSPFYVFLQLTPVRFLYNLVSNKPFLGCC